MRGEPEVRRLRSELESIDRGLVLLLASRARTQHELFRVKSAAGRPLKDPAQERRVLRRAELWAQELGIEPAVARRLLRSAMRAGLAAYGRRVPGPGDDSTVTVYLREPAAGLASLPPSRSELAVRPPARPLVAART